MPHVTVRALAEFAQKPIADQMRILAEQKRPAAGAAAFKVHYYQTTRAAIGSYFKFGNDPQRIHLAIAKMIASQMQEHKKKHNQRAMKSFLGMKPLASRSLQPVKSYANSITSNGVDVRCFPDLIATEGGVVKYFLLNCSESAFDHEAARRTLELTYWLLNEADVMTTPGDIEFVDLCNQVVHVNAKSPRKTVVKEAIQNLKVIDQVWPIV